MDPSNMDPSYNEIQSDEEFLIACDFGTLDHPKNKWKQSTPHKKPETNPFNDGYNPVVIEFVHFFPRGNGEAEDSVAAPPSSVPLIDWDLTFPEGDPNNPEFWVADQPLIPLDDPSNPWMDLLK